MISLLWCACAFGEMHAIERVLPTLFGIAWHLGLHPVADARIGSKDDSKDNVRVNPVVVHCNKKPDRMANTKVGLLSASAADASGSWWNLIHRHRFNPR